LGSRHARRYTAVMSTFLADLVAILAKIDQQIAKAKDAIADPSVTPAARVKALLDMSAMKATQVNMERLLRQCTE
jgi:hypothetical protein